MAGYASPSGKGPEAAAKALRDGNMAAGHQHVRQLSRIRGEEKTENGV